MNSPPAGAQIVRHDTSDAAASAATTILTRVFGQLAPENARQLRKVNVKLIIVPADQKLTDLPEYAYLKGVATFDSTPDAPRTFDDIRGAGGEQRGDDVLYAIAEEELTPVEGHPSGYGSNHVAFHESGHVVYHWALTDAQRARVEELWMGHRLEPSGEWLPAASYTAANPDEYFANSVAAYFEASWSNDLDSVNVYTREWLRTSDPAMYALLKSVFDETPRPSGFLPHVPTWEKVGAGVLVGASVLFGVGFMNAGDETVTHTEPVAHSTEPAPEPAPAGGLAELVTGGSIAFDGQDPVPVVVEPGNDPGSLSFEIPLFAIDEEHHVVLQDSKRRLVDEFTFVVPEANGATESGSTVEGGQFSCVIDHQTPVPPGASGADCDYEQPAIAGGGDGGGDAVPTEGSTTEETDGAPWSLLLIPGGLLMAGGFLVVRENQLIGEDFDPGLPPPKVPQWLVKKDASWKQEHQSLVQQMLDQLKDVNIGKELFTSGYTSGNCSFCAIAADSTLAGKPVSAPPRPPFFTTLEWWREKALEKWGARFGIYGSPEDVAKAVEIWGDGARGILVMTHPDHAGHVINVINVKGHVLFIDTQQGIEFTNFNPYQQFHLVKTTK